MPNSVQETIVNEDLNQKQSRAHFARLLLLLAGTRADEHVGDGCI